jgi:hypothetical protein
VTDNTKIYPCLNCECGRSLQVERVDDDFILTLVDPEIEFSEWIDATVLRDRLVEAEEEEFMVFAADGFNEGSIFLSDAQIADLREWVNV